MARTTFGTTLRGLGNEEQDPDTMPLEPPGPIGGGDRPSTPSWAFDWDRVDRARKMRSFYEPAFFGKTSTYDNPQSAAGFTLKNAPEGASMQDLFGSPAGFWGAQNTSAPARDFTDLPPPTMGGFGYGSPFGPEPIEDTGGIYADAMRKVNFRRLNEGPGPGEFLSGYGTGQLQNYGVGALRSYGVGALHRR